MASIHPELAQRTLDAARWLANTEELLNAPLVPLLQARFGLTRLQAVQALWEAAAAHAQALGVDPFEGAMRMLAEEVARQKAAERKPS